MMHFQTYDTAGVLVQQHALTRTAAVGVVSLLWSTRPGAFIPSVD